LKIAFVGAGSVVFTKNLLTDILGFTELRGASIAACAPHRAVQNLTVRAAWKEGATTSITRRCSTVMRRACSPWTR
jgi:hypothetical protein